MGEYEGWSNRATWAVNLWISNEEPSYRHWTHAAQSALADATHEADPAHSPARIVLDAIALLATRMESELESEAPELGPTLWSDLMSHALASVNWYEIAQTWIQEACDEQARQARTAR